MFAERKCKLSIDSVAQKGITSMTLLKFNSKSRHEIKASELKKLFLKLREIFLKAFT